MFATDRALELVGAGMPFRDAYRHVKEHLDELDNMDPHETLAKKTHWGAPAGLDFGGMEARVGAGREWQRAEWTGYCRAVTKLMGNAYPRP